MITVDTCRLIQLALFSLFFEDRKLFVFHLLNFGRHFWTLPENTNLRFGQVDYLLLLKPISFDNAIQEFSFA